MANTRQLYATQPMTAQVVSQIIGCLFEDLIGVYRYDDNTTRPAITINKPIENRTLLESVECVVGAAPKVRGRDSWWSVYFLYKDYDGDSSDLGKIANRLRALQTEGMTIDYLPGDKTIEAIPQISVKIPVGYLFVLRRKLRLLEANS